MPSGRDGPAQVRTLLRVSATHLYSGARASLTIPADHSEDRQACMVEFSDGVAAFGTLTMLGPDTMRLGLDAHRTSAGTGIAAKIWLIAMGTEHARGRNCRVVRQIAAGESDADDCS